MLAVPRLAGEQTSNRATFGDVSPEVKTHGRDDVCAVQDFLRDFGYLTAGSFDAGSLDAATSSALERYQQRNGLVVTGVLDGPTRRVISQPRCGMPDLVGRAGFVALCPWVHPCLTFAFDIGTNDVPGGGEFQAVRDAFATWAAAAPLTFTEVGLHQHPDVVIGWRTAGDPDFDLAGKLAHADFPPGCGVVSDVLPKPVHFNDSTVNWTLGDLFFSHDVESVALHELGHILGLHHSDVDDAVMAPTLTSSSTRRVLAADDLAGITHLYPAAIPKLGVVTIRQQSTGRFLDAHEIAERDFRVVTRPDQDNETQRWLLNPVGTVNVIRQKTSGRFLDAFQSGFEGNVDFRLMTRDPAPDESQRWVVVPVGDGSVTIRQLSTNRLVDAHEIAENDFAAVTRPAQDGRDAAVDSQFRRRQHRHHAPGQQQPVPRRPRGGRQGLPRGHSTSPARRDATLDPRSRWHRLHAPPTQQRPRPGRPRHRRSRLRRRHAARAGGRHPALGRRSVCRRKLHDPPTEHRPVLGCLRRRRPRLRCRHPAAPRYIRAALVRRSGLRDMRVPAVHPSAVCTTGAPAALGTTSACRQRRDLPGADAGPTAPERRTRTT